MKWWPSGFRVSCLPFFKENYLTIFIRAYVYSEMYRFLHIQLEELHKYVCLVNSHYEENKNTLWKIPLCVLWSLSSQG